MRWPWQKRVEKRSAAGGYTSLVSALIEAQSTGQRQLAGTSAAVEAVAGLLSRSFASATVEGGDAAAVVTPAVLAQIGRDIVRQGESLHVLRYQHGRLVALPSATWYWVGSADPMGWFCTPTVYGPTDSVTYHLPASSVIFATWGASPSRPYHGIGPTTWASDAARLTTNAERSLADEAGGPLAQLLPVPQDGGDDSDDDPLKALRQDIREAKGKALLIETVAAGWGEGKAAAPQSDWKQHRLGPNPPAELVELADAAFGRVLASCGCSPALFDDSDGTSKREALRQWHLGTVRPLASMLEHELSAKLATPIRLRFDLYNVDLAGRAQAFQKLVAGGVPVTEALATTGLLVGDE